MTKKGVLVHNLKIPGKFEANLIFKMVWLFLFLEFQEIFDIIFFFVKVLLKPQLNHNLTQPNIALVGLDTKMTLQTTPPTPHRPPPQKLNASNISAVTDPILMKL